MTKKKSDNAAIVVYAEASATGDSIQAKLEADKASVAPSDWRDENKAFFDKFKPLDSAGDKR